MPVQHDVVVTDFGDEVVAPVGPAGVVELRCVEVGSEVFAVGDL